MKKIFEQRCKKTRSGQCGGVLLEILVSVLLFALGIVALVGLQGRSLVTTSDVQYRAEAMHLSSAYLGKIWAAASTGLTGTQIQTRFDSGNAGAEYNRFSAQVTGDSGFQGIPGGVAPTVTITPLDQPFIDQTNGNTVTLTSVDVAITITWRDQENNGVVHNYTQVSSIGLN
jgi:type IV pilus assembly protein PilV